MILSKQEASQRGGSAIVVKIDRRHIFVVELDLWRVDVKGCVRRREAGKDSNFGVRMEHYLIYKFNSIYMQ